MAKVRSLIQERREKQPLGLPSCGSVFRNPPGDHAARLIESAGLKGFSVGGAEVSTKHANFIINSGTATAADVEALIEHVRDTVQQVHGVSLVHEVHIVGESAAKADAGTGG
jgi:UDP-N-acetylmuramate dehydrogenase